MRFKFYTSSTSELEYSAYFSRRDVEEMRLEKELQLSNIYTYLQKYLKFYMDKFWYA